MMMNNREVAKERHEYCMKLCTEEMAKKFNLSFPAEMREVNKSKLDDLIRECYRQRMFP